MIPIESHRIALAPKPGIEGSDYINASWLNGHNKLKEFIVTQHPTTDTKEDFWRMLWDHNAQTVVLLSTCDSEVNIIRYSEQQSILSLLNLKGKNYSISDFYFVLGFAYILAK